MISDASSVLILDLSPIKFSFLAWFMREEGIDSVEVASVEEARELMAERPMTAVVLNSAAPVREAARAVRDLRDSSPSVPIATYRDGPFSTVPGSDLVIERPMDVNDVIRPLIGFLSKLARRTPRDGSACPPPASG